MAQLDQALAKLMAMMESVSLGAPSSAAPRAPAPSKPQAPASQPGAQAQPPGPGPGPQPGLATEAVTLLSHTHGRERREERGIEKRELQAAVKHGHRSRAYPGRDGSQRWKFEYQGVVYVTDATCRHEITSWRLGKAGDAPAPAGGPLLPDSIASHTVFVVDASGSMRKDDVQGYRSRTEAVYESLARDFVAPQLALNRTITAGRSAAGAPLLAPDQTVVSIIEMSDQASLILHKYPMCEALLDFLRKRKYSYARSHGNYLPALDKLDELLEEQQAHEAQLFVLFLSDGAPSDHTQMQCPHGVRVWEQDPQAGVHVKKDGREAWKLADCGRSAASCRGMLKQKVEAGCLQRIKALGEKYGRDRFSFHTVAFGPLTEDYAVLQRMATAVPRSSFRKLGLSAEGLHTAFSTLTGTLTTLRTDAGGGASMTLRTNIRKQDAAAATAAGADEDVVRAADGWHVYALPAALASQRQVVIQSLRSKQRYSHTSKALVDVPLHPGANAVAVFSEFFSKGAERCAYKCTELAVAAAAAGGGGDMTAARGAAVGEWLVAKESVYEEQLRNARFHYGMAKLQAVAQWYTKMFNARVQGPAQWHVDFVQCHIYEVLDQNYLTGRAWILAEPKLDGQWHKWNNNVGGVWNPPAQARPKGQGRASAAPLGAILEEDEEEEDDEEGQEEVQLGDVMQCFSHFTWSQSGGKKLICDLQGVWNAVDGFMLTDPVVHSLKKKNGSTDKGPDGMFSFFKTHRCSALCRRLRLAPYVAPPPTPARA